MSFILYIKTKKNNNVNNKQFFNAFYAFLYVIHFRLAEILAVFYCGIEIELIFMYFMLG